MSRAKLRTLGIQLPLLPTTISGSLPAFADLSEEAAAHLWIRWIRRQEELDLDVLAAGSWQFAQKQTVRPVKAVVMGPRTVAQAKETRKEIRTLVEAGAKIIQIDEPTLVDPSDIPPVREALEICTKDLPAYFIVHLCSDLGSDLGGDVTALYPAILDLPVDQLSLDLSGESSGVKEEFLTRLSDTPTTKDLAVGILDMRSSRLENRKIIRKRIEDLLLVVPETKVWVSPTCQLNRRTPDEVMAGLQAIREAVDEVRQKLSRQK